MMFTFERLECDAKIASLVFGVDARPSRTDTSVLYGSAAAPECDQK